MQTWSRGSPKISRKTGEVKKLRGVVYNKSVVASLAYRGCCRLVDETTGIAHDYRNKGHLAHTYVALPPGCGWAKDRQLFSNIVERAEKRGDSRVGREIVVICPKEMLPETFRSQVTGYVNGISKRYTTSVIADIHDPNANSNKGETPGRNLHAHIFLPTRKVSKEGMGKKIRELDLMWDAGKEIEYLREEWARLLTRGVAMQGEDVEFDHRSYLRRGIELEPQVKEGRGRAMANRGLASERIQLNQEIAADNAHRITVAQDLFQAEQDVARLESVLTAPVPAGCLVKKQRYVNGSWRNDTDLDLWQTARWLRQCPELSDVLDELERLRDVCYAEKDYETMVEAIPDGCTVNDLLEIFAEETERRKLQQIRRQERARERANMRQRGRHSRRR